MRLWTLHPQYLDARGLVALWREGLLAQKVLQGGTRGYRQHPQLARFLALPEPQAAIASYLCGVLQEAGIRGYRFNEEKIGAGRLENPMLETDGQLLCEWSHLKRKLEQRDPERLDICRVIEKPAAHPLFRIVPGDRAAWERAEADPARPTAQE